MANLETKLRFVAIAAPIKRANIAVPIPNEPPSNLPIINTVTSIESRALEIRIPVRLWIEVISPSRGPGPMPQVI